MLGKLHHLGIGLAVTVLDVVPRAHCERMEAEHESLSIIEAADAAIEGDRIRIKTPPQLEAFKHGLYAGKVNVFEGLRFSVQKQVNLNSAVNHM
jgi:hypothetical protein